MALDGIERLGIATGAGFTGATIADDGGRTAI